MKMVAAAGLGLAMLFGVGSQAEAAIAVQPLATGQDVIQVYGGCGPYGHRGPWGGCRSGGQWGGYRGRACPPGWHLGGGGRRCWPNRY